jgi:hypothetical protein
MVTNFLPAKISDEQKVAAVLDSYKMQGLKFLRDEETLTVDVDWDGQLGKLPRAVKWDELLDRNQYPDEDSWLGAISAMFNERGEEGFLSLLRELAPYLETPLAIAAVGFEKGVYILMRWRIEPGASEVEFVRLVSDGPRTSHL